MVSINNKYGSTDITIDTSRGTKFGRFELVFQSYNEASKEKSTLKTDTILMNIYTLKFASDLPPFEVTLG